MVRDAKRHVEVIVKRIKLLEIIVAVVSLLGCDGVSLTEPDADGLEHFVDELRAMSPPRLAVVRDHKVNHRLRKWAADNADHTVGYFRCDDRDDSSGLFRINRAAVYTLMQLLPGAGLDEILDQIEFGFRDQAEQRLFDAGDFEPCNLTYHEVDGIRVYIQAWLDDETLDDDSDVDSAKWLIALSAIEMSRRPSLMSALGISTAAGGILIALDGIGLVLCPLSDSIACPNDPGDR